MFRGLVRVHVSSLVLVGALAAVACASSDETSSADAGRPDVAVEASGNALPTCVGEGGYQCQPKGCLSGFSELKGWDCGNANASCCAKDLSSTDASSDATSIADAKSDG